MPTAFCFRAITLYALATAACLSAAERAEKITFSGFTIPITVGDSANVERSASPVSGGIPIARGALSDTQVKHLVLADSNGQRIPSLQTPVPLGHWSDGSVKWLLVNFLADGGENSETAYTLGISTTAKAITNGIHIGETADTFTVDTGKLRAVLSKKSFSFLGKVWVDADGDGNYSTKEQIVDAPGEMFIDLDLTPPGAADAGERDYPDTWHFGMEGGNWLRKSQSDQREHYRASTGDYSIKLFREGRTETVFKIEGWHRAAGGRQFGKYSLYLHFYANQDFVRVFHTWIMTGDPEKDFIRSMGIEVPVALAGNKLDITFGGPLKTTPEPMVLNPSIDAIPLLAREPGPSRLIKGTFAASDDVSLTSIGPDKYYHNVPASQDLRVEYKITKNGEVTDAGFEPSGWVRATNGSLGVAMGLRDFWHEHPKQVRYHDGVMTTYLWPEAGDRTMDLRRRYPDVRGPGPKRGGSFGKAARREFNTAGSAVGVAKTTELFFSFHKGKTSDQDIDRAFRDFQDPLRPVVDPKIACKTGVFGPIVAYDPKQHAQIENYVDLSFAWPMRSAEEFHWYGMFDYGDHLLEYESINWELSVPDNSGLFQNWGYSGWMQESYRTGQWLFIQYVRSGRARYWREADTWLRHHRDVDCVHWDTPDNGPRPEDNKGGDRLGGGHRHDQQHWGTYLTSYGIPSIALTHHYYLTGDGRDLDVMRENCEWLLHKNRYENEGVLSVLYMAEALGDQTLINEAMTRDVKPGIGFGRLIFDSGMALMLRDIQTNGDPAVRAKLTPWAALDDPSAIFIRAYLYAQGEKQYYDRIKNDFDQVFPAKNVRSQFFAWAKRRPNDFRDAFSADIIASDGIWNLPFRTLEKLVFDAPFGMGNNTARNQMVSQVLWLIPILDEGGKKP